MNNIELIGGLTRTPELKEVGGGSKYKLCAFTIAYTVGFGEKKHSVYVDCEAWGHTAEYIVNTAHCQKGYKCSVSGKLDMKSWKGKDGETHSRLYLSVSEFNLLERKNKFVNMPDFSEVEKKEPEKQTSIDDFMNVPDGEFPEQLWG